MSTGEGFEVGIPPERLPDLLDAVTSIGSELRLDTVLRRVVRAGIQLTNSRYGALGVLDDHGTLADFVFEGIDEVDAERIGHLPEGRGLLGALIAEPQPLRLADLTRDPRAVGFPDDHPPMHSFLGVPVRTGDRVFGNLYLTEKQHAAEFSAEDEALAVALASVAGLAIAHARLHDITSRREQWLDAFRDVANGLLGNAPATDLLGLICERAGQLANAKCTAIVVRGDDGALNVAAGGGAGAEGPLDSATAAEVLSSEQAIMLRSGDRSGEAFRQVTGEGPAMLVPLSSSGGAVGVLIVVREESGPGFGLDDLSVVEAFAQQAAVVLEYIASRAAVDRVRVVEDRQRIARDLHDTVIQRIFAAGMTVQVVAQECPDGPRARLNEVVDQLDDTIRELRSSIFALQADERRSGGLRGRVDAIVGEAAAVLGFRPIVRFQGPVDTLIGVDLAAQVVAVVQEGVSNAGRHAEASSVTIDITAGERKVSVVVADDGNGRGPAEGAGRGLVNLEQRAERLGGSFEARRVEGAGTTLVWTVPLEGVV